MQILLSPAKDMTAASAMGVPFTTRPLFQTEAEHVAMQMSEFSADDLADMLHINPKLAALNLLRYHQFPDAEGKLPAVLAYTGMAYRHLRAAEFSTADFEWAQSHLWITSFLYGLNRPLDEIKNYRLEGKVVLPDNDSATMFQFWKSRLTDVLIESVKADDGVLVNLTSAEMKQLFDWRRVERELRIITPDFRVDQGDRLKTIVVYAKMMRGAMARQLIVERIATPEALHTFDYEGFSYRSEHNTPKTWAWVLG